MKRQIFIALVINYFLDKFFIHTQNKKGIVMWEILTRKSPFEDVSSLAIPVHVSKGERPKLPKKHSGFEKLIKKCWAPT